MACKESAIKHDLLQVEFGPSAASCGASALLSVDHLCCHLFVRVLPSEARNKFRLLPTAIRKRRVCKKQTQRRFAACPPQPRSSARIDCNPARHWASRRFLSTQLRTRVSRLQQRRARPLPVVSLFSSRLLSASRAADRLERDGISFSLRSHSISSESYEV